MTRMEDTLNKCKGRLCYVYWTNGYISEGYIKKNDNEWIFDEIVCNQIKTKKLDVDKISYIRILNNF